MTEKGEKQVDFYKIYNDVPKIGPIPRPQILPLIVSLIVSLIIVGITGGGAVDLFFLCLWIYLAWLVASAGRIYDFTDSFVPNPNITNGYTRWVNPNDKKRFKLKKKKLKKIGHKTLNKKENYTVFQNFSDLDSILEIDLEFSPYAVFLNFDRTGAAYAFIPFRVECLHPHATAAEKLAYIKGLAIGAKHFPFYENLQYVLECQSFYGDRAAELEELATGAPDAIALLNYNEIQTVELATRAGIRQEWNSIALGSWSEGKSRASIRDTWWERWSEQFDRLVDFCSGTASKRKQDRYCQLAGLIDQSGYHHWQQFLQSGSGLKVRPLSMDEAWEWLSLQFIDPPDPLDPDAKPLAAIPVDVAVNKHRGRLRPQILVAEDPPKDLITKILEQTELNTKKGYEVVKVGSKWMGALALAETCFDSEDESKQALQLDWFWEILSQPWIKDTKIAVQLEKGDKEEVFDRLVKIGRQGHNEQKVAAWQEGNVNVEAIDYQSESYRARRRLKNNDLLVVGLTVFLFRPTLSQLNRDLDRLKKAVKKVRLIRENKTCFQLWLEFLPINSFKQLATTSFLSERRTIVDNLSLPLLLPLMKPKPLHSTGVEFLSNPGGQPINFDPFLRSTHFFITGKTGTGKDVLLFDFVKLAVSRSIKVVGMDLTEQSNSPFKLPLELLGDKAAYVNLLKTFYNILQPPNLIGFDPSTKKERRKIWQTNLIDSLYILVVGRMNEPVLCERIESLIIKLVKVFLEDSEIIDRYNNALISVPGTAAWQNIPVLEDLLFYCTRAKLGLDKFDEITRQALNQIRTQIRAKLDDPNIGEAIGSPSSVPPEPLVTLFAFSGLNSATNSQIMTQVAHMACLNAALSNPKSFVFINEFDALGKRPGFSRLAGEYFARKRKDGCSVAIAATSLESIKKCSAGAEIVTNFDTIFVGKVTNQLEIYSQELKIPLEILEKNARPLNLENQKILARPWLIWRDNVIYPVFRITPPLQLALLANNDWERAERAEILAEFPNSLEGIFEGLKEFSKLLIRNVNSLRGK